MKLILCVILSTLLCIMAQESDVDTEARLIIGMLAGAVGASAEAAVGGSIGGYVGGGVSAGVGAAGMAGAGSGLGSRAQSSNKEQETFEKLLAISSKITELEAIITETPEIIITKILQTFPNVAKLELSMNDLKLIINQINFAYEQMREYLYSGYNDMSSMGQNNKFPEKSTSPKEIKNVRGPKPKPLKSKNPPFRNADVESRIEKYTLDNFATWATDHGFSSLSSLLRRLHDLIAPQNGDGIFNLILQVSSSAKQITCNLEQSLHQTLYNLYHSALIAQVKGNAIIQFSYYMLETFDKGIFIDESEIAFKNFKKYVREEAELVRNVLSMMDRTLYKCDPKQYEEGITHSRLTKLMQGYIENEINLNTNGTCWDTCEDYRETYFFGCSDSKLCPYQPSCNGKVINCRYVQPNMDLCLSTNPERRYDWIEYENGKIFGKKDMCETKNLYGLRSWTSKFSFRCAYCLCVCDDVGNESDRYFNLRDVTSDVKENKIVTGLRIVKNKQIIHLQIQQGRLRPYGAVNSTSLTWKPIDSYSVYDFNVYDDTDYFTMDLSKRGLLTNELSGPTGHVVTGVRFRKIGTLLGIDVRVTPIDYKMGTLKKDRYSYWLGSDDDVVSVPRAKIELIDPDIPIRQGPHTEFSKPYEYTQFQQSSFEADAGQNTVPFFDSQELSSQGYPLSGLGLIHRGKRGSGGFVAPKLISYDYSPHLI